MPRLLVVVAAVFCASAAVANGEPREGSLGIEGLTGTVETVAHCDVDRNSHIEFRATGVATGTVPGTFVERGEITVGPQLLASTGTTGQLVELVASFRIDSPATETFVTGAKKLAFVDQKPDAGCEDLEGVDIGTLVGVRGSVRRVNIPPVLEYDVEIHTPDGTLHDEGRANLTLIDTHLAFVLRGEPRAVDQNVFREFLISRTEFAAAPASPDADTGD